MFDLTNHMRHFLFLHTRTRKQVIDLPVLQVCMQLEMHFCTSDGLLCTYLFTIGCLAATGSLCRE